ncbi:MAG TPA: ABC transporter permease [Candidatus Limnocylindria bacterium]|nr:ABC transporter permease [Candidatus Limnocylindria bacterium]
MQVRFGGFGLTTAGIRTWRGLGASARLGWQVSSNWTSPGVFLVYSVLRPVSAALILTVIYQVITRGRATTYLAFLITGTGFWSFVQQGLSGFANAILDDRGQYRMLKYIYIAPQPFGVYLVGRAIAQLAGAAASAVIVIGLGTITLHLPINPLRANWLLLGVACLLAFAAIVAIGMAFTFLLLAGRDTHGYGEIGAGVLYVISGAIFPIGILPGALATMAALSPLAYWMELVRRSLLQAQAYQMFPGLSDVDVLIRLVASTIGTVVVASLVFRWADRRGRQQGYVDRDVQW